MIKRNKELTIDYWKEHLLCDQEFFEDILKNYSTDLTWLAEMLVKNPTVRVQELSVPNELVDFIDGNGFILGFEGG